MYSLHSLYHRLLPPRAPAVEWRQNASVIGSAENLMYSDPGEWRRPVIRREAGQEKSSPAACEPAYRSPGGDE
jgi:hypothetical protein